jgi:hypothetical protein
MPGPRLAALTLAFSLIGTPAARAAPAAEPVPAVDEGPLHFLSVLIEKILKVNGQITVARLPDVVHVLLDPPAGAGPASQE